MSLAFVTGYHSVTRMVSVNFFPYKVSRMWLFWTIILAMGVGRSKKEAKHAAAKALIDKLTGLNVSDSFYQQQKNFSPGAANSMVRKNQYRSSLLIIPSIYFSSFQVAPTLMKKIAWYEYFKMILEKHYSHKSFLGTKLSKPYWCAPRYVLYEFWWIYRAYIHFFF